MSSIYVMILIVILCLHGRLHGIYRVRTLLFVGIPQVTPFGANKVLWKESQEMVVEACYLM